MYFCSTTKNLLKLNILRKIETIISGFVLRQDYKKVNRIRKLININDAITIGLLFIVHEKSDYEKVSKFVEILQKQKKTIKALALVESEILKEQIMPKLTYDLFSEKNLNWYKKPFGFFIDDFIKKDFDILINLDDSDTYPIKYILAQSKAKLKIGIDDTDSADYLDIMIKTKPGSDIDFFMNEAIHYLTILKTKN